jgi:alkyl sulfatase BDS1-like metallo-beta-lactamase superfamily hydrolase
MIQAAASVAAMMPAKPNRTLLANRQEQLVYFLFEAAVKAAYLRAAQECLNAGYDAQSGGIDLEATHEMIADKSVSLGQLIEMCQPGYAWGGSVVTL